MTKIRQTIMSTNVGDEKYFWKAMNDNFGLWLTVGSLNPRGPVWMRFLYTTSICSGIFLFLTAYKAFTTDTSLFIECMHFIIFVMVTFSFWLSFNLQKETVFDVYTCIGKEFYDYGQSLDEETKAKVAELLNASRTKKHMYMKMFSVGAIFTCVIMNIMRPILKYFHGEHLISPPDDGMFRLLPVTFWAPIRVTFMTQLLLILLVETASFNALGTVVGHNLFFLMSCEECATQCAIVSLTLRNARKRAQSIETFKNYSEALKHCLAHSIRHHQTMIKVVKKVEKVIYYPALVYLLCSAFLLCVSGFLFMSDKVDLLAKTSFGLFLISELFGILVYCYYGEKVKTMSSEIFNEIYFGEWIEDMRLLKNYNLLLQARTQEGLKISAGGFMYLNLETYTNVLSSAFSYFNILNAINS